MSDDSEIGKLAEDFKALSLEDRVKVTLKILPKIIMKSNKFVVDKKMTVEDAWNQIVALASNLDK